MTDVVVFLDPVLQLAKDASRVILEMYQNPEKCSVKTKWDQSPVTEADLQSHNILVEGLQALDRSIPVLSEEGVEVPFSERQQWDIYWAVDPLDGTKEFIHRTGEFTINIALIKQNYPILGVIYSPIRQLCYYACEGLGAFRQIEGQSPQEIHVRPWDGHQKIRVVLSRRHMGKKLKTILEQFENSEMVYIGSALKFCTLAEGNGDLYLRLTPAYEWDLAAGQCILEMAGGAVFDFQWQRMRYNTRPSLLMPNFLALSDERKLLPFIQLKRSIFEEIKHDT